jgi:uncharacterized protein YkwD
MRRIAFALVLCSLAIAASLAGPTSDGQSALERAELLHLTKITNAFRRQLGLPSLKSDPALGRAAQLHAKFMAVTGIFGHQEPGRPQFLTPDRRVRGQGYDWVRVGENICWGFPDSEAALSGWIHSPPHRSNLVDPNFTEIGLGSAQDPAMHGRYWVMVLGQRRIPQMTGFGRGAFSSSLTLSP